MQELSRPRFAITHAHDEADPSDNVERRLFVLSDQGSAAGIDFDQELPEFEVQRVDLSYIFSAETRATAGCLVVDVAHDPVHSLKLLEALRPFASYLPVIVLADKTDIRLAVSAMKIGAFDVLEKPVDPGQLRAAVHEALGSVRPAARLARSQGPRRTHESARRAVDSLTSRQQDILGRIVLGHPNKIVASDLGISQRTVENHRAAIMRKLSVSSISALIQVALAAD